MKTKLIAITAAAMLAGMSQFAIAAPAASPAAGIPGLGALGSLPLPALPLGVIAAPFAGLPVLGPMAVQGANSMAQGVPSLVNLVLNVVVNLPGLGNSLAGFGAGGLPALSPSILTALPGELGPASTNLLQALNSASAAYGIPALPTALPGL